MYQRFGFYEIERRQQRGGAEENRHAAPCPVRPSLACCPPKSTWPLPPHVPSAATALQPPEAAERYTRQDFAHSGDIEDSHLVTTGMQCLLAALAVFVLSALLWKLSPFMRMGPSQLLGTAAGVLGAIGAVRLSYGLGSQTTTALLYAVVSLTPIANMALWTWQIYTGLRALREAGWQPSWRTFIP